MSIGIYEKLSAAFTKTSPEGKIIPDLCWRFTNGYADGKAGYCPYITAEHVKKRLNEVIGVENWSSTFEHSLDGKSMTCTITATIDGKTVSKSGVGSAHGKNDNIDADKTMESDSLKRAAVSFGIGLYIKDMKEIVCDVKLHGKFKVPVIKNSKGETIFLESKDKWNSYFNTLNPYKAYLIEISNSFSPEKRKTLDAEFKKIWDALTANV